MIVQIKRVTTLTFDDQGRETGRTEQMEECWEEDRPDPPSPPEPEDPDCLEFQG